MALDPFIDTPKTLREWSRWCEDQLAGEADSVVTTTILDDAVTYAKIQDVAADRILGRLTTAGVVSELTAAQLVTLQEALTWAFAVGVSFAGAVTFAANIGFHGEAASAQQTTSTTLSMTTITGTSQDTELNANFAAIEAAVNLLKTALDTKGLTA